jgi:2-keto-3-deoxy-L-rhamnonate aldolase RhmA
MSTQSPTNFRQCLSAGKPLLGTFIKTPGTHAIEVLGEVGFDFVVIDAEHAPWDRSHIDLAVLAAKSQSIPALVRVQSTNHILNALDCGADGVMVPHVSSVKIAQEVVSACRYRGGSRGFTNSSRAGRYGALGLTAHVEAGDARTTVIAMLEDREALDEATEIALVPGIDAFFLGRGDLTVALGQSSAEADLVKNAIAIFVNAVKAANKPLCAFIGKTSEVAPLQELGVSTFILASDQGLLRGAATSALSDFRQLDHSIARLSRQSRTTPE